jgi:hypothetical protein
MSLGCRAGSFLDTYFLAGVAPVGGFSLLLVGLHWIYGSTPWRLQGSLFAIPTLVLRLLVVLQYIITSTLTLGQCDVFVLVI